MDQARAGVHPSRSYPSSRPTAPFAQRLLLKALAGIQAGRLDLEVDGRSQVFGDPGAELRARVRIHDWMALRRSSPATGGPTAP